MIRTLSRRWSAAALLAAVATAGALLNPLAASAAPTATPRTAAAATLPVADGLSEMTAAASCWEIKQRDPRSASGVYWLKTAAMTRADQFYCDQDTNGGGWLLVGRGRDAWSTSTNGSGSPAQVRDIVTGSEAFVPRQLPGALIDQLNNNQPISSMTDGIRLHRATNIAGTSWHDLTFTLASPRAKWTWQFNNEQRVNRYSTSSSYFTYSGGQTSDFGFDSSYNRVRTVTGSNESWKMGFGFGRNISGRDDSTSFLWSKTTSSGYARPFTQVFVRPMLTSSDLNTPIPAGGTPAVTGEKVVNSFAETQNWGVAGLGRGPATLEGSNETSAFAQVGDKVFVGGNFLKVQKNASGSSGSVDQSYLAAFAQKDAAVDTNFRPTFDNQVKALAALPGNRIAVGGYFTQVNGADHAGFVVLNATTGAVDTAFTGRILSNSLSGEAPFVRTLDVQGDWLYVGGSFTHSTAGDGNDQRYTRNAGRFSVSTGQPDRTWNPEFNGTPISVDASADNTRVYFAGFFSTSQNRPADKGAALSATSTDLITWPVQFSNRDGGRTGYQQAVLEVGDRVWLAGSEHSIFSYRKADLSPLSSSISKAGGDFQALATDGNAVYGGCHCFETQYEGATTWPDAGTRWTAADAIYGSGAWSASTGERIPSFNGEFNTRAGAGAWALFVDSAGTLWQGGDYSYSHRAGYNRQWSGGFVRHAQQDASPPTTPTALTVTASATTGEVSLSWDGSTDDRGVTGYQVLRHDRVVATVTGTSATLPAAPTDTKYFVRAIDARGNASASTAGITATVVQPKITLIDAASTWSYLYSAAGPSGEWTTPAYDASAWNTGKAPLGWGQSSLGTTLNAAAPKPLASFYRQSFEVADATKVESVELTTRADDGVVVYVNGTEVLRKNVDPGVAGVNTYATAAVGAAPAVANPVTVTVPGYLFTTGTNVITASVHSNYRTTPSHSFELTAVATPGTQPEPPVTEPEPETGEVIANGSDWSYLFTTAATPEGWNTLDFDASTWATGAGALGWGHTGLGTAFDITASPRPVTSYYRHAVTLESLDFESLAFSTRADDGIVVYVNGVEVARKNLGEGPVTQNTYANAAVGATAAAKQPFEFSVPASAFREGANVVSAEVHSNYRSTPSHSFELSAVKS